MAVQTCDQAITFRNFNYARALEVVQDEEYLDDIDFDFRLRRKQGEVFQAIDNFNEKIENNFLSEDSNILGESDNEYQESHHREKRFSFFGSSCGSTDDTVVTTGLSLDFPTFVSLPTVRRKKRAVCFSDHPWEKFAKVLIGIGILKIMNPAPGPTPDTSPRCGQPGGGGCPGDNNPGNILDLVPPGLTAVATFPPFANPFRQVDAVAVIYKEPPGTFAGENTGGAGFEPFRRSSGYSRQPSLLDRFRKNIRCLGPRLAARFGKKPDPVVNYGYGKKKRDTGYGYGTGYGPTERQTSESFNYVQEECGTIEDCFDQPCPRFGIVVKATFEKRTPSYGTGYGLTERQTGESFKSAAPPDCRVTG